MLAFVLGSLAVARACAAGQRPHLTRGLSAMQAWDEMDVGKDCSDVCIVPDTASEGRQQKRSDRLMDVALVAAPFLLPAVAFCTWESVARSSRELLDTMVGRSFISVDGGALEIALIVPTVNGIVVPSISIVLGTLCAGTIGTLRQRQETMRARLNAESCDITALQSLIVNGGARLPDGVRLRSLAYLRAYTSRILSEAREGVDLALIERAGVADSELNGLLALAHSMGRSTGPEASWGRSVEALVQSLARTRSERLAALFSMYPLLHWAVLLLCQLSILLAFLIESDGAVLRFLDNFQLRVLWSALVGTFSAIDALMVDLVEPFAGMHRIDGSAAQLAGIRAAADCDLCLLPYSESLDRSPQEELDDGRTRAPADPNDPPLDA